MSSSCCYSSSASFSAMSFNLSRPYSIFSIILLYNKEAVSCTLYSLSASASRVAATGADTTLYNFVIWFLIKLVMFIIGFLKICFQNFWSLLRHSFSEMVISYQIVKKPIIWYPQSMFYRNLFTTYLCMCRLSRVRAWLSRPLNQRFLNDVFIAYLQPSCVSQFHSSNNVFKWRIHRLFLYAWLHQVSPQPTFF